MIEEKDIERLKEIFVMRGDCEEKHDMINKNISDHKIELALMKQMLGQISWVSKTTLAAVIVALVGAILKLVLVG